MIKDIVLIAAASALIGAQPLGKPVQPTAAGIHIPAGWRQTVYDHARQQLKHVAWGWRHSERDYLIAREIARADRVKFDDDVLFAAAFLHDAGAIAPFAIEGVDHAERSVQLAEPLLREAGFPMTKFPKVRAAILDHMFDTDPVESEATLLHDADTLDFLGATGAARLLSVTSPAGDIDSTLGSIRRFVQELPPRLKTPSARKMSRQRIETMRRFLLGLEQETPRGATL